MEYYCIFGRNNHRLWSRQLELLKLSGVPKVSHSVFKNVESVPIQWCNDILIDDTSTWTWKVYSVDCISFFIIDVVL